METASVGLSMEGIERWQMLNGQVELRGVLRWERFEPHIELAENKLKQKGRADQAGFPKDAGHASGLGA